MAITSGRIPTAPAQNSQNQAAQRAAGRSVGTLSNYGESTPVKQLSVGQVLKGEVTDLRNNEIVVTLEDNTKVAARLENGVSLSIGDTAAFRVKEASPGRIALETLPKSYAAVENSTINKALEEAGLPKNEKNISVVRELMQQGMPINRQAIQNVLVQAYAHKTVDIRTLILMAKEHMPLANGAPEQFQNHIDNVHPMAGDIASLAEEVANLLQSFSSSGTGEGTAAFGKELLSLLFPPALEEAPGMEPSLSFLTPEERSELANTLEMFSLPEGQKEALLDGSLSLREAMALTKENINMAMSIDSRHMEEQRLQEAQALESGAISPEEMEAELSNLTKTIEAFDIGSVRKLFDQYSLLQNENNELGAVLDQDGRESLSELLKDFPLSPKLKEQIQNGEAPVKDVLATLKNTIPLTDGQQLKSLFSSKEFHAMLKAGLTANWTLTPNQLKNPKAVEKLYDSLYEQTAKLSELAKTAAFSGLDGKGLEAPAQSLKQNMDFMNTLNQMFPYIELPIRLKEQLTHGDLYVYTKKQALKKNKSNVSVLLHLDLSSLGPLDVKLSLNSNVVDSTFYFSTKEAMSLVSNNIFLLEEALVEKGYLINTKMEMQAKSIDIVKDFMKQDAKEVPLKRYSFDIRA